MKKRISLFALMLTLIAALSFGVLTVFAADEGAVAPEETTEKVALTDEDCKIGASIRFADEKSSTNDIKFQLSLNQTKYDLLNAPEVSFLVTPEGKTEKEFPVEKVKLENGNYIASIYFYNVPAENLLNRYNVNVKVADGADKTAFVSAVKSISIAEVALAALNDTEAGYTDEQKAALQTLIPQEDKLSVTTQDYTCAVGGSFYIPDPVITYDGKKTGHASVDEVLVDGEKIEWTEATRHFTNSTEGVHTITFKAGVYGVTKVVEATVNVNNVNALYDVLNAESTDTHTFENGKLTFTSKSGWDSRTTIWGEGNAITEVLNAKKGQSLVLHCTNPQDSKLQMQVKISDKVTFENDSLIEKIIVQPNDDFEIVISNDEYLHAGDIYWMEFIIADAGKSFVVNSAEFVDNNEVATDVWANGNVPTSLNVNTDMSLDHVNTGVTFNATEQGLELTNTTGNYLDVELYGDSAVLADMFKNISSADRYNRALSYKVTNLGDNAADVYDYFGTDFHNGLAAGNEEIYHKSLAKGESNVFFVNPAYQTNGNLDTTQSYDYLSIAIPGGSHLLVSEFKLYNYDVNRNGALTKTVEVKNTDNYNVPAYKDVFPYGKHVDAEVGNVTFSKTIDGEYTEVAESVLTGRIGYYKVTYVANGTKDVVATLTIESLGFVNVHSFIAEHTETCQTRNTEINGIPAIEFDLFTDTDGWEGGSIDQADFINKFNDNGAIKVTVKNTGDTDFENTAFYFGKDTEDVNIKKTQLKVGEVASVTFNRANYAENVAKFEFWAQKVCTNPDESVWENKRWANGKIAVAIEFIDTTLLNSSDFVPTDTTTVITDYVVENKTVGVSFETNVAYAGAKTATGSTLMSKFNSMTKDQGMKVSLKNIDTTGKTFKGLFYMDKADNTNSQFIELAPNEEGAVYFKNDGRYNLGSTAFEYWLPDLAKNGKFAIVDVAVVNDADVSIALFDEANKGAEIAKAMGDNGTNSVDRVSYVNGEFIVNGINEQTDVYIDLLKLGEYSANLKKYFAEVNNDQRRKQVLAVDVKLIEHDGLGGYGEVFWLGIGEKANNLNYNNNTRVQKVVKDEFITIYLHPGMTTDDFNKAVFNYVQIETYHTKLAFKNFRVLNLANMEAPQA